MEMRGLMFNTWFFWSAGPSTGANTELATQQWLEERLILGVRAPLVYTLSLNFIWILLKAVILPF